jgi:hypothetical protein
MSTGSATAADPSQNGALVSAIRARSDTVVALAAPAGFTWAGFEGLLTTAEKAAFAKDRLMVLQNLFDGTTKTPSAAGGINPAAAIDAVAKMDKEFRNRIVQYSLNLNKAVTQDKQLLDALQQKHDYNGFVGFFTMIGHWFSGNYKSAETIAKETSASKKFCLSDTGLFEQQRLEQIKALAVSKLKALADEMIGKDITKVHMDILKQAYQMCAIYKAHFPNDNNSVVESLYTQLLKLPADKIKLLK